jgi:TolB-like protein/Flp pilus assembly protein TadD
MRVVAIENPPGAGVAPVSDADVLRELETVLASPSFRDAELLRRFLRYSVERTLLGGGDELKEYRLGVEVFGRDSSFDPRLDPVVRMAARRLRAKLEEYYGTAGRQSTLHIGMPKGRYVASFMAADPVQGVIAPEPAPPIRSVAVLPFQNLSGDAAQEYLADGITETLITDLAQIRALRVISRTSAWSYKATTKKLPEIARELNVEAVVEGSVLCAGDRVRVSAQLIEAPSDTHLWAQSYDASMRDLLDLQSQVAQAIAQQVGVKLTSQEQVRIKTARLVDPEAHEAYLLGRYYWNKRTPVAIGKALELFDDATRIDPNAAEAYAAIASAYVTLLAGENFAPRKMAAKARSAAEKAISLDDALAEPHAALGVVKAVKEYDWPGCDAEFQKAFERDVNCATAHHWYGYMLMVRGRVAAASEQLRKALRLDPLNPVIMVAAAGPLNYSGRHKEALQQVRKQLELDPHSYYALWGLGEAYAHMGKFDEAARAYRDALAVSPGNPYIVAKLCYVLGRAGHRSEALGLLREMQRSRRGKYLSGGLECWAYAGLGDKRRALDALEKAYADRAYSMLMLQEPYYDCLRSEPRFQAIAKAVGLDSSSTDVTAPDTSGRNASVKRSSDRTRRAVRRRAG